MKEEMTLKEFTEEVVKPSMNSIKSMGNFGSLIERMIQLEAIENWINVMYGVELDIKVRPVERKQGRFYGKGIIESLTNKA